MAKIRSAGADVQGVQKTLSNNHCKEANCLLSASFTRRHATLRHLSAVKYQLHVREIRADNARQWHGCFLCWWHRLAVWSKEWRSQHLSRRWAWLCIMWITSTVCYSSWNVVKLKCNNLSLVNSNYQDFFLKTKTETFTPRPRPRPRPRLWLSRPRPRPFLSSRRLETKTVVSRTTSLNTA